MQEENQRLQRELEVMRTNPSPERPQQRPASGRSSRATTPLATNPLDIPRNAPSPPPPMDPRLPPPIHSASPLPPIAPARGTPLQQLPASTAIIDEISRLQAMVTSGTADASVLRRITELERQLLPAAAPAAPPVFASLPPPAPGYAVGGMSPLPFASAASMPLAVAPGAYGMPAAGAAPPWLMAQFSVVQQQLTQMESENKRLLDELKQAEETARAATAAAL